MSDLINRKDLLEIIAQTKRVFDSENQDYYKGYMCALSGLEGIIAGQPTAYDVGKVVEELKEASFPHSLGSVTENVVLRDRAIEIVKEVGGMND